MGYFITKSPKAEKLLKNGVSKINVDYSKATQ